MRDTSTVGLGPGSGPFLCATHEPTDRIKATPIASCPTRRVKWRLRNAVDLVAHIGLPDATGNEAKVVPVPIGRIDVTGKGLGPVLPPWSLDPWSDSVRGRVWDLATSRSLEHLLLSASAVGPRRRLGLDDGLCLRVVTSGKRLPATTILVAYPRPKCLDEAAREAMAAAVVPDVGQLMDRDERCVGLAMVEVVVRKDDISNET